MDRTIHTNNGSIELRGNEIVIIKPSKRFEFPAGQIRKINIVVPEHDSEGRLELYTKHDGNIRMRFSEEQSNSIEMLYNDIKTLIIHAKPAPWRYALVALALIVVSILIFLVFLRTPSNIDFDIAWYREAHIGRNIEDVRRYIYYVVVHDEATPRQLERLTRTLVRGAKNARPFNAVQFRFYDRQEFAGRGRPALGMATYAPNGEWRDAYQVRTGQYRTMRFSFQFNDVDWSQRLTAEEAAIWGRFRDLWEAAEDQLAEMHYEYWVEFGTQADHLPLFVEEEPFFLAVADEFGIPNELVQDINSRWDAWTGW